MRGHLLPIAICLAVWACWCQEHALAKEQRDDSGVVESALRLFGLEESNLALMLRVVGAGGSVGGVEEEARKATLEVIAPSFPKTGTMSLTKALRILGVKALHSEDLLGSFIKETGAAARNPGKNAEYLVQLVEEAGSNAIVETPAYMIFEEVLKLRPEIKVIHILRDHDMDNWLNSYREQASAFAPVEGWPWTWIIPDDVLSVLVNDIKEAGKRAMGCPMTGEWWTPWYFPWIHTQLEYRLDRGQCKQGYRDHIKKVRSLVSKGNLLEFRVSQGWEPLCTFLGLPVPDSPFPHSNSRVQIAIGKWLFRGMAYFYPIVGLVLIVFFLGLLRSVLGCLCGSSKRKEKTS